MDLKKLKEVREMRRITLKGLSKAVGVNRNRLSRIEQGAVNPSYETVEAIVKELGFELVLVLK
jgi:transcriptional regulator with XRE-family HTH domain